MRSLPTAVAAIAALAAVPFATAAPTCTGPVPAAACGGRVVAEPLQSATFIQYGTEIFPVLEAIEAVAPEVVEVYTLDELAGDEAVSAEGREIPLIRLTDESVTTPKRKVAVSLSVHANESAGREGGVRWIEDVARWWAADKSHEIYSGDNAFPLSDVMAQTEVWLCICNVDGWAYGDLGNQNLTFQRGNGNDVDLNRQFPTLGWPKPDVTPLGEPEAAGWARFLRGLGPITTSTDIHGELTSANNAFSDLMWPADQWTPKEQAQELQLGLNVVKTIERKFDEAGVVLGELTGASGTMTPAEVATGYDVVGYDDAGFMGDWFSQETGAIDIDAENFFSHMVPGNVWVGALEQAHVAAVRGIVEAVVVESMITGAVRPKLDLGRVGYVFDPARVTGGGTNGTKAYDVSRMEYFEDLAATGASVTPIDAADVATADLGAYDSIVLADVARPADRRGRAVDAEAYAAALVRFADDGGQLVLTDGALSMLADLGFGESLMDAQTNAGHVDVVAGDHEWTSDLLPTASQTYYEVPLGFAPDNAAPHFGVDTAAWEEAGGVVVGTINGDEDPVTGEAEKGPMTVLGELARGKGKVSIFGAILPRQETANDPLHGLADYGVTIAGGQILHSMLSYRRVGAPAPVPPAPVAPPEPGPRPAPLPSTGWDPAPLLLALPVTALLLRRRKLR